MAIQIRLESFGFGLIVEARLIEGRRIRRLLMDEDRRRLSLAPRYRLTVIGLKTTRFHAVTSTPRYSLLNCAAVLVLAFVPRPICRLTSSSVVGRGTRPVSVMMPTAGPYFASTTWTRR